MLETVDFGVEAEGDGDVVAVGVEVEAEDAVEEGFVHVVDLFACQGQDLVFRSKRSNLIHSPLVITQRYILQVHISITGPQLIKQIILENHIISHIILLIQIFRFHINIFHL